MNRDDLLKRCVDRRVAHETSVVAVSHLFYVYLLSALKKGQRVEVPNFGTFGTHIVGVKRQRRMPFFEVENDLADKVNERYKNLKTLLVGKFELTTVDEEIEYAGKQPPFDPLAEKMGKEVVLDTSRDISVEPLQHSASQRTRPEPSEPLRQSRPPVEQKSESGAGVESASSMKEKKLMPKLNLRGEGAEGEPMSPAPPDDGFREMHVEPPELPPTLRDISGGAGPSPLLQVLLGLLILGAITFALNHFGLIHLWGSKGPAVQVQTPEESLPPVVQPPPQAESGAEQPGATGQKEEPTLVPQTEKEVIQPEKKEPVAAAQQPPETKPTPEVEKKPAVPLAGTGQFTIQVSSWPSSAAARRVVSRLASSGFDAYIVEGQVKGKTWYRVRVGRYQSAADAQAGAESLKAVNENGVWVTKLN